MKGYYQPAGLVGWVNWAWIIMIALFSLIMQLEVTHFNIWTGMSLALFIIIAMITYFKRTVVLDANAKTIRLDQPLSMHTVAMSLAACEYVQFTKHTILFNYDGESYHLWLSRKLHTELQMILRRKDDNRANNHNN